MHISELLSEYMLLLCLVGGAALSSLWLWIFRERLKVKKLPFAIALAVVHTLLGVLCVKLFAGLENLGNPLNSGMSLFGAVFLLPVFYALGAKIFSRGARDVFDVFTLCVISVLILVRMNCIDKGCCMGKLILGSETLRYPTREIEMLFHSALLAFMAWRLKSGRAVRGDTFPLYMMCYGAFRFIEEFFREGGSGVLHISHIWSIISFAAGCAVYFELRSARRKRGEVKNRK